jgi:FdhE protein
MTNLWERRLRRANRLENEWPFAGEILAFYRSIIPIQADMARQVAASGARNPEDYPLARLGSFLDPLLDLVAEAGPEVLAREAADLLAVHAEKRVARVIGADPGRWWASEEGQPPFFTRVLLEPYLATLPLERSKESVPRASCPFCGGAALVGLLREDRSAGARRRTLQCSLCSREWDCARVLCPACGEERPEKLPRYEAEEIPWVRIEACDSCLKYVKAVDLSKSPEAEPVVDELASTPLDVIARERRYAKLAPNLAGI